jgi:hypothetical protein
MRGRSGNALTIHAVRKDGFAGPIKLVLKNPPAGFTSPPQTISASQDSMQFRLRTSLTSTQKPLGLSIEGIAKIGGREVAHRAVPAEDRMQAFLWRHLVPAKELMVAAFDPPEEIRLARTAAKPSTETKPGETKPGEKPKFTQQQVAGRLRQLKILNDDGLLTKDFYDRKVKECETGQ